MNLEKDFDRNRPSDEGRRNDPNTREESAQQPGASTYSSSENDDGNQNITRTAGDNFDASVSDEDADATYDDVEEDEEDE